MYSAIYRLHRTLSQQHGKFFQSNQPILGGSDSPTSYVDDFMMLNIQNRSLTSQTCRQHTKQHSTSVTKDLSRISYPLAPIRLKPSLYNKDSNLLTPLLNWQKNFYWENQKTETELNDPRMFCFHKLWNAHGECVKDDVKNLKCLSKASFQIDIKPVARSGGTNILL